MKRIPSGLVVSSTLLILVLLVGGAWFFFSQEKYLHREVESDLASIAHLKVNQIVQWRSERLGDAATIVENPFLAQPIEQLLSQPDPVNMEWMAKFLESLVTNFFYTDVLLVDLNDRIHISFSHESEKVDPGVRPTLQRARLEKKPVFSDLYLCDKHGKPCLDVVAPIFSSGNPDKDIIGFVVLRSHAETLLYPLLQNWPGKSESAETLLVRREGDHVLFLNELRHQQDTALKLSLPLTDAQIPAVQAVLGKRGVVQGTDYRGVPVLAALNAVPGTSWCLVSKIDTEEAFAVWKFRSLLILFSLAGMSITLLTATGLIYQQRTKQHYRNALRAETVRRQAEEQYRITLMSVGDGVIVCDKHGRITLLNHVAEKLTGWSKEDALGRRIEEVFMIINEETRQPVENPITRVLNEGLVVGLANHTLLITADGQEFPIADSGAPIFNENNCITGVVLVFRDQSEERKAEASLRRSNQLLARAEEMAAMGCWEFDLANHTFWASESARHIYGLDDSAKMIVEAQQIPLPEYRKSLDEKMRNLIEKGEEYDIEFKIRRQTDGAILDVHSKAEYMADEHKIFGLIQDITARKKAEAELIESQSRYFSLFQNNHAVMLLIDPVSEAIIDANPAAVGFYGWTREELLKKKVSDINTLPSEYLKKEMEKALFLQKDYFQFQHRLADGSIRDVEIFTGAIRVDGKERLYSIVHDITDRKIAEEQRERLQEQLLQAQKLESVGLLAGGVAHDLNNLLSPILGYSDLLLADLEDGSRHKQYVHRMQQAGNRARDLVQQLLAFGRKQTLIMTIVELDHLVESFVQLLHRTVREDIAIKTLFADKPCMVNVDSGQIEQVIMNLVVNAQDAMPDGGQIVIETDTATLDQDYADMHPGVAPGTYVMLAVADTGCGMTEEVQEQIFAPFFTTKGKGKGSGLGLATVYGIVKQHGGHIWVYSEVGQGTTFKIYFPFVQTELSALQKNEIETVPGELEMPQGSELIMVVEDNDMVRQMTVDILARRGYEVLAAASGHECLIRLHQHGRPIDLLVTDVVMPEMNGKELYARVKESLPQMKVLYMSGYTENVIAKRGVLEEGVNFIQKPFNSSGLAVKVRDILDGKIA